MSRQDEISIDWCSADRIDELQRFIETHWQAGHVLSRDRELLRWQHRMPNDHDRLSVAIADSREGKLCGMLGVICVDFCADGQQYPGGWLTQWIVPAAERTHQLGLKLLNFVTCEIDGMIGTLGGNRLTMGILRALRFHTVDAVPRWIRPGDPEALARLLEAADQSGLVDASAARRTHRSPAVEPSPDELEIATYSDVSAATWDQAWLQRFAPRVRGTWRDAEYLQWRYLDHPRLAYDAQVAIAADGQAHGLLVTRLQQVQDRPERVLRIVELLADERAEIKMAEAVATRADEAGVAFCDFYCTSSAAADALERAGFMKELITDVALPSLFQPLDARRSALTGAFHINSSIAFDSREYFNSERVYFTLSDADQDRPA